MSATEITPAPERKGFWHRQFFGEATTTQLGFDIVVGIVGPVLCFVFDPIAFREGFAGQPLFPQYQVFVYLLSGMAMVTLLLWLSLGQRLYWKRLVGGILIAGGGFCIVIGCLLFPFSMMGLVFVIGFFGFTPFLTAIVYIRNGCRAIRSERTELAVVGRTAPVLCGCLLLIGAPAGLGTVIDQAVSHSVNAIIQGDAEQASMASTTLKWLNPLSGTQLDRIVNVYLSEPDASRKERLRRSYLEITGQDIETKSQQRFVD